jgi:5-hydroxyisourate hydrolase
MSGITTHVLDTSRGRPAAGVPVKLEFREVEWIPVGEGVTDEDGRLRTLLGEQPLREGHYRLIFDVAAYNGDAFFPEVTIAFEIRDASQHYHVPLLLSPFGYSTYRGS